MRFALATLFLFMLAITSVNAQGVFDWLISGWATQQAIQNMGELQNQINNIYAEACSTFSSEYYSDPFCASYRSSGREHSYSGGYRARGYYGGEEYGRYSGSSSSAESSAEAEDRPRKSTTIVVPEVKGVAGKITKIKVFFRDSDGNPVDGIFYIAVSDGEKWIGQSHIVTTDGKGRLSFKIPESWSGLKKIKVTFKGFVDDEMARLYKKPDPEYVISTLEIEEPPLEFDHMVEVTRDEAKVTLFIGNPKNRDFNGKIIISYHGSEVTRDFTIPRAKTYKKFGKRVKGKVAVHISVSKPVEGDLTLRVVDSSTEEEIYIRKIPISLS